MARPKLIEDSVLLELIKKYFNEECNNDCKVLLLAIQSVMEEKGNMENIQEAMLKLNTSKYSYKAYLEEKLMNGTEG